MGVLSHLLSLSALSLIWLAFEEAGSTLTPDAQASQLFPPQGTPLSLFLLSACKNSFYLQTASEHPLW